MTKRGRPPKNGVQPAWMFFRVALVVRGYNEARQSGEKHSVAVRAAIENVKRFHPEMPISETEVKRILAYWQPREVPIAFNVSRNAESVTLPPALQGILALPKVRRLLGLLNDQTLLNLPKQRKFTTAYTFGYGPRPLYPRHNAKSRNGKA